MLEIQSKISLANINYLNSEQNLFWKIVGVTTIAGGKSNVAGYRDGPSEDAKFSSDFDVVYVRPTCSLLVVDRGNAALRQISLNQEDCDYQYSSISATGLDLMSYVFSSSSILFSENGSSQWWRQKFILGGTL